MQRRVLSAQGSFLRGSKQVSHVISSLSDNEVDNNLKLLQIIYTCIVLHVLYTCVYLCFILSTCILNAQHVCIFIYIYIYITCILCMDFLSEINIYYIIIVINSSRVRFIDM